jgi:hypothetical protein
VVGGLGALLLGTVLIAVFWRDQASDSTAWVLTRWAFRVCVIGGVFAIATGLRIPDEDDLDLE